MKPSWQRGQYTQINRGLNDPLAEIYNESQWRLNKVSPLYNLNYSAVKLKQYAAKIRQSLASTVTGNSMKYTATVTAQPSLKYSEDDSEGLVITVSSSSGKQAKISYVCILLSWGISSSIESAVHLPFLIERGEQRLGSAVKTTIQSIFDCNVKQYCFTQSQLLQLSFSCLDYDTSRRSDPFTLVYRTPQGEVKDKLTMQFIISDMLMIWNGVKEEVEDTPKQVAMVYQVLKEQILHTFDLNVSELELYEVNLPKSEVKSNGIVKMKTPEAVNCVFTMLNEMNDINYIKT